MRSLSRPSLIRMIIACSFVAVCTAPGAGKAALSPAALLQLESEARDFFDKGDFRKAEKLYLRVVAAQPKNLKAICNLAVAQFREGETKHAEQSLLRALALAPNDAFTNCTLGIVYYAQNRLEDARKMLVHSIQFDPNKGVAHNYLGVVLHQKGQEDEAQKEFEKAKALDEPDFRGNDEGTVPKRPRKPLPNPDLQIPPDQA